jgi:hypothetical protein
VKICNLPTKRVLLCTKLKVRNFFRPLKCRYELKICLYFMLKSSRRAFSGNKAATGKDVWSWPHCSAPCSTMLTIRFVPLDRILNICRPCEHLAITFVDSQNDQHLRKPTLQSIGQSCNERFLMLTSQGHDKLQCSSGCLGNICNFIFSINGRRFSL